MVMPDDRRARSWRRTGIWAARLAWRCVGAAGVGSVWLVNVKKKRWCGIGGGPRVKVKKVS